MCLAGYMLRNGETEEDVLKVLEAAWSYHNAPRKAFQDLRGVVPDTAENLELGEPVTGGRVLEELMPGLPKKIAKFLGWEQVNYDGASFAVLGRLKRPGSFNLTEMGNAERFVADHGGNVRYCYAWSRWLVWTGVRWERDEGGKVHRLAKETVRGIYQEAAAAADENRRKALAQHATRSEAEAKIRAMLELAKSEVPVSTDELDANPWLLNCNNGTIDLRTGELREHRREDLITKLAPVDYDADAEAPEWAKFLADVLPSVALRAFVQRAAGYSLTADTRERILFILHGMGRNGKSTFLEALREVLGADDGYAMKTPAETLMAKPTGGIPNDVARLNGARFVSAAETEANRRLAEALVKEITGNDTISARFMRAEWFDFKPTHKVWLATNHKPEIKGTDPAIWDRIRLVPFTVRIPDDAVDLALPGKLKAEIAGILSWAVEGCLEWQREGLGNPEEVRAATDAYRQEMDTLARFIEDRCVLAPNAQVDATPLFNAFKEWCVDVNETPGSQKSFGMRLKERGFEDDRDSRTRRKVWRGIGLFTDVPDPDGASFNTSSNDRGSVNAKRSTNSKRSETVFEHNPARQEFSSGYTEKRFRMVSQGKTVSQGEPDNGSKQPHAPAHENLLQAFFEDPPAWFVRQGGHALKHYPDLPERILKPLASSVAYEVLNDPHKGGQALPLVRTKLEEMRP